MKLPTTTFKDIYEAQACTKSYRHLAKALGGITKYGRTTPITCLQILDACGLEDLDWALENAFSMWVEQPLGDQLRTALNMAYDAAQGVFDAVDGINDLSNEEYATLHKQANEAEAAERKKQTVKLRKYLVKHGSK